MIMLFIAILFLITFALLIIGRVRPVYAHCDTLDGPVVTAAREALDSGDVNIALVWVRPEDEAAVREAFNQAVEKRSTAADEGLKAEAEIEFFEYLVKIHREGEGETYEGLKSDEIPENEQLADQAVDSGNLDEVLKRIDSEGNKDIIKHLFNDLLDKSHYKTDDLEAGRKYVAAYAHFMYIVGPAIDGKDLGEHSAHHHHEH
jgi:hypothetical protein